MCQKFVCAKCGGESETGRAVQFSENARTLWSNPSNYCTTCAKEVLDKPPSGIHRILATNLDNTSECTYSVHPGYASLYY